VVRVLDYRSRGPGFDEKQYKLSVVEDQVTNHEGTLLMLNLLVLGG
jgi:hypothetical protein